jgi:hypothetical protein
VGHGSSLARAQNRHKRYDSLLPLESCLHVVVALALPAVKAFDLAIPAEIFGDGAIAAGRYSFSVCAPAAGRVPSTAGVDEGTWPIR